MTNLDFYQYPRFQFHKGTIKPRLRLSNPCLSLTFNSIKVQLSRNSNGELLGSYAFQFHKGTIKPFPTCPRVPLAASFNSIKVQLSRRVRHM